MEKTEEHFQEAVKENKLSFRAVDPDGDGEENCVGPQGHKAPELWLLLFLVCDPNIFGTEMRRSLGQVSLFIITELWKVSESFNCLV